MPHHSVGSIEVNFQTLAGIGERVAQFVKSRFFQRMVGKEFRKGIGDRVRLNIGSVSITAKERTRYAVVRFIAMQLFKQGGGYDEAAAAVFCFLRFDDRAPVYCYQRS